MNINDIKHMVEELMIFTVNGYDKDNDVFVCYGEYKDIEKAVNKAKKLAKKIANGKLMRKCADGTKEPIDWVEVWNENTGETIWASYNI